MKQGFFILMLVAFLFSAKSLAAGEAFAEDHVVTFTEFYTKVLRYYPRLRQESTKVEMAIARKMQAAAGFWPRLSGAVTITSGDDPVYVFGTLLRQEAFTQANFALDSLNSPRHQENYNFSLQAEMPLFDAFQTIWRVKSGNLRLKAAYETESFTRMEAFLVAADAYLRALTVEELITRTAEVLNDSEEDLKQAADLKEKGVILGADFFAAKVRQGSFRKAYNELIRQHQASLILLNILMGEDPFQPITIQGHLDQQHEPRAQAKPRPEGDLARDSGHGQVALDRTSFDVSSTEDKSLAQWLSTAFTSRPDLIALEKEHQVQEMEVKREKASFLPRLSLFGTAQEDRHDLGDSGGKNFLVGIKGEVDFFDPTYKGRVHESQAFLRKAERDREILRDTIANDLTQEYSRRQTSADNFTFNRQLVADAREAVNLTRPLYREGRKSIVDLMAVREAYLNVAVDHCRLELELKSSALRLLFLSGQLDEAALQKLAQEIGGPRE